MKLTDEQIIENYNKLIELIENSFEGERKEKLLAMYEFFKDRLLIAPASGLEHYHNCFEGGYVDHVLRVVDCAQGLNELWKSMGAQEDSFTEEELIFSALNHDLGKIGDKENPYYVPNPSEWHRKNQGKIYDYCEHLTYMSVPDRSLFLLQQFGIECTTNETLAIRLHDGLYDSSNESYLKTYQPQKELRTHLPILLHHADHMASRIEHDSAKASKSVKPKNVVTRSSNKKKSVSTANENADKLFKDLFGE